MLVPLELSKVASPLRLWSPMSSLDTDKVRAWLLVLELVPFGNLLVAFRFLLFSASWVMIGSVVGKKASCGLVSYSSLDRLAELRLEREVEGMSFIALLLDHRINHRFLVHRPEWCGSKLYCCHSHTPDKGLARRDTDRHTLWSWFY